MKPYDVEIAAPVGSFESLHAAIQGGCDSIYFGVGNFNLRSYSSTNFKISDLKKIAKICDKNNIKKYLTLNSIIYDNEFHLFKKIIEKSKEYVSGIIVSDPAVLIYLQNYDISVHLSTQMNISNLESVKFYSKFSDVMVLARELNLNQIQYISKQIDKQNITGKSGQKIKLEIFVHGALCMSVSGKCFLSLHTHNKSANRGECFQNCRRPYSVIDDQNNIFSIDNPFILSSKDLCTLPILDKILKTNVKILKIEGRGRSPEYVKTVVSAYKQAVSMINHNCYSPESIKELIDKVKTVYNRDFWTGHYLNENIQNWYTKSSGSQSTLYKEYIGDVVNFYKHKNIAEVLIKNDEINAGDQLLFIGPTTGVVETVINDFWVNDKPSYNASKGNFLTVRLNQRVRSSDKVYKLKSKN